MCDPVTAAIVIGVGAAASGAAAYKQTRHNNKNMKRAQNAKNAAFQANMERQRGYADEAGKAFDTSIEDRGSDSFKLGLEDASQNRLQAFNEGRLEAPSDYSFGSTGRVFHIAENLGLLKYKLKMECGWDYTLLPPSVIKKFATDKGNANKDLMLDAFEKDTGTNLAQVFDTTSKSPVSDVADAYFICKYTEE